MFIILVSYKQEAISNHKYRVLATNLILRDIYSYKYQLTIMYVYIINTLVLTPRCQRLETRQIFN